MKIAAWILCILSVAAAFQASVFAATSIHQIYAAVGFLTAAVLFGTAAILGKLDRIAKTVEESSDLQLQWFMDAYKTLYLSPGRSEEPTQRDGIPFKDAMRRE